MGTGENNRIRTPINFRGTNLFRDKFGSSVGGSPFKRLFAQNPLDRLYPREQTKNELERKNFNRINDNYYMKKTYYGVITYENKDIKSTKFIRTKP